MTDLFCKYSKARELVPDTGTGTLTRRMTFLQVPELRRLVGCQRDSVCFPNPLPSLLKVYAKQIFSLDFIIAGSGKTLEEREVSVRKTGTVALKMVDR